MKHTFGNAAKGQYNDCKNVNRRGHHAHGCNVERLKVGHGGSIWCLNMHGGSGIYIALKDHL
jgi:hypothetical protein